MLLAGGCGDTNGPPQIGKTGHLERAGIYLEDLFVKPEHRGKGYGKALLQKLAQITMERGCGRLEWSCLDWNKPSIDFYLSLDATPMDQWTVYRLTGATLRRMAAAAINPAASKINPRIISPREQDAPNRP